MMTTPSIRREADLLSSRERKRQLSGLFRSRGPVGRAFNDLRKAGCDAKWLKRALLSATRFPLQRERAVVNTKERQTIERVIANLESAGSELRTLMENNIGVHWYVMAAVPEEDWPVPPHEAPGRILGIASCLKVGFGKAPCWPDWRRTNVGRSQVAHLVAEVTKRTGKPHYPQMKKLLSAVYDRPGLSQHDVKMMVKRSNRRQPGNTSPFK